MTDPENEFAVAAAVKRLVREGHDLQTIAGALGWTLEDVVVRTVAAGGYPRFTPAMKAAYSQVLREFATRQLGCPRERVDDPLKSMVMTWSKRGSEATHFAAWEREMCSS